MPPAQTRPSPGPRTCRLHLLLLAPPTHPLQPNKLREAMGNALYTYRQFRDSFVGIQKRGMEQDLSWDNAASQYEEVIVAAKYQW